MNKYRFAALAMVLGTAAFASACEADREDSEATIPATEELEQPAVQPVTEPVITGDFEEPEGAADVDGNFELRSESPDASILRVELEGLTPGEHAWHIHEGDCANLGQVVIALTPATDQPTMPGAQALMADADGKATATVTIPRADLDKLHTGAPGTPATPGQAESAAGEVQQRYSINVHQQAGENPGPPAACANLDLGPGHGNAAPPAPQY